MSDDPIPPIGETIKLGDIRKIYGVGPNESPGNFWPKGYRQTFRVSWTDGTDTFDKVDHASVVPTFSPGCARLTNSERSVFASNIVASVITFLPNLLGTA